MFLIEKLSNNLAFKVASTLNLDKDKKEIIAYGAFNFIQTIWCIIMVIILGMIFKVPLEALVVSFSISILRKYSGGAHSTSPNRCALIGALVSVGLALFVEYTYKLVNLSWLITIIVVVFLFAYYNIYKYAPVDSPAKPIVKEKSKQRMKKGSIFTVNVLVILVATLLVGHFIIGNNQYLVIAMCICLGVLWQVLTLTPKGYLVLSNIDTFFEKIINILGGKK
ncbi:accessory gene regulator B family protein [Clostridium sp. A1-XYC3]|uniref:Accessory gene regulator B family protein n=1 Tax=Clostridium tanneri TaxID=3037988 RepID=A0ABU4JVN3_9CLOT|nr:accessory gene regulator B family protein [Clostridium sp. A1-XYC3]MDW8802209.1 accessory gene regulator B family protein [Clostridium sp. A1-XYC3]